MNASERLQEVKAAYRSLGIKPTRRSFFSRSTEILFPSEY
jgi:hypothetical protein